MDRYAVGVDFGTLSGRALVVRVGDGAELGTAVHEYAHARDRRPRFAATGAAAAAGLGAAGPGRLPRGAAHAPCPRRSPPAGVDPARRRRHRHRLHRLHACCRRPRDGTPLCELPDLRDRPHAYPKLWKHHAAQPQADRINALAHERGEPWLGAVRRPDLRPSGSSPRACSCSRRTRSSTPRAERWIEARRLDHLAAVRRRDPQRLHRRLQGRSARTAATRPRTTWPRSTPASPTSSRTSSTHPLSPLGDRAGGLTAQAAAWTGLPEGIAVASATSTPTSPRRRRRRSTPGTMLAIMGTSTCHVMNGDHLARGARHVRRRRRRHHRRAAGATRPARAGSATSSPGTSSTACRASYHDEAAAAGESRARPAQPARRRQSRSARTAWSRSTGWSGNRSVLVDHELCGLIVGLTLATRPPDIYRALLESTAFGTRTIIETFDEAGVPVDELVVAGGLSERRCSCRSTPT